MNNSEKDIDLIRKYFSGDLDGPAMQKLEERALEDPFLADAMMGFEEKGFEENDILYLKEKIDSRIKERQKSESFGGPKTWAVAASVVIAIACVSIYFSLPQENKIMDPAKIVDALPYKAPATTEKTVSLFVQPDPSSEAEENEKLAVNEKSETEKNNFSSENKAFHVSGSVKSDSLPEPEQMAVSMRTKTAPLDYTTPKVIKGKVVDALTNTQISGAIITDPATGNQAISDPSGEFSLSVTNENTKLVGASPGHEKNEIHIKNKDSVFFTLEPEKTALSEDSYKAGAKGKILAGPTGGWPAFKKYLHENDELETREVGAVTVEFFILPSGELTNFKITKSLSKLADARAIDLIRNFQEWRGASNGRANKVKITIRFR